MQVRFVENDESDSRRSIHMLAETNLTSLESGTSVSDKNVESPKIVNNKSRSMQILLHQFKGLPPSNQLAVSQEIRYIPIFSAKSLLQKLGLYDSAVGLGSLMGSIVYDRNTASIPGFHLPLVLDMVRDSVKNRLMNVLGFACIFCSVILILSSFVFVSPQSAIPHKVIS
jgi:hypothetical protein